MQPNPKLPNQPQVPLFNEQQRQNLREMPEGQALKQLLHQHKLKRSQATRLLSAIRRKY